MRRTKFPGGIQGNLHAAGGNCRSHTIKKTCGNRQSLGWFAGVRWRDESVALPDTLEARGSRAGSLRCWRAASLTVVRRSRQVTGEIWSEKVRAKGKITKQIFLGGDDGEKTDCR